MARHSKQNPPPVSRGGLTFGRPVFKCANRSLRKLKTYFGRVIRDIGRRIAGDHVLEENFACELGLARRVLAQDRHQRGRKVSQPCEFGVKVSVATPVKHSARRPVRCPYRGATR